MQINNDEEIFEKIAGYNYSVSKNGNVRNDTTNRILKPRNNTNGYHIVGLLKDNKQKYYLIHRLIALAFIPNPDNKPSVDHIDTNSLNNNVVNLRWCSQKENSQNKGKQKNNKSGFKGVCYDKKAKKYKASIKINGKYKHLGLFKTALEASVVYEEAAKTIHGEFYYKN